ncbi:MAG TPA: peptidyl-prolyl cis-trans isomerase [Gemmata sp.]|nr:peptidyl-prolyl cis-trans isomerase [Gemmata sp.]
MGQPVSGSVANPPLQTAGYALNQTTTPDPLQGAEPQIRVVALVGGTGLVTDQEIVEAVRQRPELRGMEGPARDAKEKELYDLVLRQIIERELILDDMYTKLKKNHKAGLVEDIKEFASKNADRSLRSLRRELHLDSDDMFQRWLLAQGLTEPVIHRQIERQTMADEYIRNVVREKWRGPGFAEMRLYYEQNPGEFQTKDRVKWLDIFVSVNRHPSPQAAYEHAEAICKQAVAGADFVQLAKKYDNGLAAGTNGVGIGSRRGEIQPADVEPTVWALRPGEVSKVIPTPSGYHIVKVVERDYVDLRPFDAKVQTEIREKILRKAREEEYHRLVEDLWRMGAVRVIR